MLELTISLIAFFVAGVLMGVLGTVVTKVQDWLTR